MAEVKWIKLDTDIFNNRKIKLIRKMPDGDAIVGIWLQILCLAGQINDDGLVYITKDIPYTDETLATEFDRPLNTIRLALQTFCKFGMLEITNNFLAVSNWQKYQSADRLERIREQNRIRKQKEREKNVLPLHTCAGEQECFENVFDDSPVPQQKEKTNDIFAEYTKNPELLKALKDFEKMRRGIKKPLTDRAKKMLLNELNRLAKDDKTKIAILNQSIFHSWQGVFELKDQFKEPAEDKEYLTLNDFEEIHPQTSDIRTAEEIESANLEDLV